jgi:PAS domain S-box-containing protein
VCNFWDITEIKNAQLKIQESNDRYNKVAKATSDAIWDLDIRSGQLLWNMGLKNMFGYETEDNTTSLLFWEERIHPEDRPRILKSFNDFLKKGIENWQDEYRFLCADAKYKFVFDRRFLVIDENGKAHRMIGAMQDITKQKEEENRLRIMESVITHTSDSVVITEDIVPGEDGPKIIYVNTAFVQMTGYSSDEIIGKTPRILQSVNSKRDALDEIRIAMMDLRPCEVELLNRKKNGLDYWVNISIAPVIDDKGKVTHWIAIQRDITERKKQEQDREMLIQELTSNNKDLKQFSYITSHNLRAPLSNLIGILNLFNDIEIKDKQVASLIKGFRVSTEQLNTTINDLIRILIIKDNPSLEQEELEFTDVLEKVKMQVQSQIDLSNAAINEDFTLAPAVKFSRSYLESILQNLISNSIKYRSDERPLKIDIKTEELNGNIILHFSDNGSGFDLPRLRDRLFGLYQRFHNHPDSKGLGLYLVKSQLEALGGKIEVDSAVNKGTRFTLYFRKNGKHLA